MMSSRRALPALCALLGVLPLWPIRATPPDAASAPEPARSDAYGDPLPAGALARLGTTRWRPGASVRALAFSPDGALAASGDEDRRVRVWDMHTGREVGTCWGHRGGVWGVAFSPDGKLLASASDDHTVRLWDAATGKQLRCLHHDDAVKRTAFAGGGKTLVSVGCDAVRRWDVGTGELLASFPIPPGYNNDILNNIFLALAPDGGLLAAAAVSVDNDFVDFGLVSTATGKVVRSFREELAPDPSARFAPDGRTFLVAGCEGRVHLWDAIAGKRLRSLQTERTNTCGLALSGDGGTLAVEEKQGIVRLRDAVTGDELHTLPGHQNGTILVFSPDGRTLLTGDGKGTLRAWDARTGALIRPEPRPPHSFLSLAWAPDGRSLLTGGDDSTVRLWDADSGKERRRFEGACSDRHWLRVAYSPDGKTVAAADVHSIHVWDVETSRLLHRQTDINTMAPLQIFFAPDGGALFVMDRDRGLQRWAFLAGKEWAPVGNVQSAWSAAMSPDSKTLLSAGMDGNVYLWDAAGGKELRRLTGHAGAALDAVFSADGRTIASAGSDRTIRLWDADAGKEMRRWAVPFTFWLSFSADGKHLASASGRTVKVWDVTTGREVASLAGHRSQVRQVGFSPDGKKLASLSDDGTILVWDASQFLAGAPPRAEASRDEWETRWAELGDADAQVADEATAVLTAAAAQTVARARERLHVAPVEARHMALIARLGNDAFEAREDASRTLEALGLAAEPALRRALAKDPDPEVRQRAAVVLGRLERLYPPEERRRDVSLLRVLERIDEPPARALLEDLAKGPDELPLVQEARACLGRLATP